MSLSSTCHRAAAGLATLLLVGPGLAACDDGGDVGPPSGSALERRIADLDGVAAVDVPEVPLEQEQTEPLVVVDAEADVTAPEVAAVLAAVAEDPPDVAGPSRWSGVVYLDAGDTRWSAPGDGRTGLWFAVDQVGDATTADRVEQWLLAAAAVPDGTVAQQVSADLARLDVTVADLAAVGPAARALADVPAGTPVAVLGGQDDRRGGLAAGDGGGAPDVAAWEALLAAEAAGRDGVTLLGLWVDGSPGGPLDVESVVTLDGGPPAARVTPQRYGSALVPLLGAQADLLAARPGSVYRAVYRPDPAGFDETTLVEVRTGRPARGPWAGVVGGSVG